VFSPAARVWPEMNWSHMIYMSYCVHGWVMCTKTSDGSWTAMMDHGGRDGVLAVPVRGRRTGMNKAHRSITGVWGCFSHA
jgi:hypothetical protein